MDSRSAWPTAYRTVYSVLALAVIAWQAPDFVGSLYPPTTITYDFYQDWASARNFLNGEPVYADIGLTIERYLGWRLPEDWPARYWRMNFHPPPAVLITLPFARLDYPDAFLLWSLFSLAALLGTVWLFVQQTAVRVSLPSALITAALLLLWYPFQQQVMQGQVNLLLLLMLAGTWAAHRSERHWLAGAVLGAAVAIKLFPGLLLLYFALRRQWTSVAGAVASLTIITAACALVLGPETYAAYVREVLPASDQWLSHWHNISLWALWTKVFNPGPAGGNIIAAWDSPTLARVGGFVSCAFLSWGLSRAILRARSRSELDQAFGMTVTAMLLMSPITWSQNLVLLLVPLALMGTQPLPRSPIEWLLLSSVAVFFVPPHWVWQVLISGGWPDGTVRPWQAVTALSFQCYGVVALFVVQFMWLGRDTATGPSPHG